jgi:uncharacterized protein (DUF1778 family)
MNTQRDTKILVHVASTLKSEIDAAAEAEGRSTSDFVRRKLIEIIVERFTAADEKAV